MKKLIYSMVAMAMAAFTFTSCEDVPMPYSMTFEENGGGSDTPQLAPSGTGTQADPFNIAAAQQFIEAGQNLDQVVYVKGKISSIKEIDATNYGNATYYISDNGSTTNQFYVYRGYALGNVKFKSDNEIKVGDEVIVAGKLVNFNGTKEFTQGNYIYSLNGKTAGSTPSTALNTEETAFTVAQAIQKITENGGKALSAEAYVKGVISKVEFYNEKYKSISYYITDAGGTDTLQIYSGKGLNGADFNAITDLSVGQTVVVKGILKAFNGKNEMDKNNIIVSISNPTAPTSAALTASFSDGMDGFTIVDLKAIPAELGAVWKHDAKYHQMKATAFKSPTRYETQSRLVSPAFSLAGRTSAILKFQHAAKYYGSMAPTDAAKVYASTNGTNWTALPISAMPAGTDWNFIDATCDMAAFAGKSTVYIAFEYNSTTTDACTWEIKNVTVE